MRVRVEEGRFLSVSCAADERIVFDRRETKYHLLRGAAARLWDEIGLGGSFDVGTTLWETEDPLAELADAGLIAHEEDPAGSRPITRRVWLTRTGKASAAAVVLPLVATIVTPRLALGQADGPSLDEEADIAGGPELDAAR
jgi:hypothetical protein